MSVIKPKRIGIDARFYGPIGKGLGRYTKEIVDNIIKLDTQNQYVIFLRQENFNDFKSDNKRVKKVLADINWYGWAEQIIFPFLIWHEHLDLMHFPHFNVPLICPVKFIVTIHDLILIKFPTERATTLGPLLYKFKNLAYQNVILRAVKKSKKVIAVSEFTKNDIIEKFKIPADKVEVTYEGVARLNQPGNDKNLNDKNVLTSYNISKPYLLYVGNAYPHKNLESLIDIFSQILEKNNDLQLVLVGKDDYFYKRLKQHAKDLPAVIFPGFVPDDELKIFYKNCLAYVFPSFYEGFGLPPLEAMAQGAAVVSSDQTSLPEILGDAALYFNPKKTDEMKNKIEMIINDENLRHQLKQKGISQVKKYSWQECARKTLEIYNQVI